MNRTTKSNSCLTNLSTKIEVLSDNKIKISLQALDANCDLKESFSESYIYTKMD